MGPQFRSRRLALLVLASGLFIASSASAGPTGSDAASARLGHFSAGERALLAPHLARGPLALVEYATDTELPAVIVAARVRAPLETVTALLARPEEYPGFMAALDRVDVRSRHRESVAYDWTFRTSLFTLRGSNVMTVYPAGRSKRGHRIAVESTKGDLGVGRMMWRVHPDGKDACVLVLSSRMDMRDANWISRKLSTGGSGVNRAINVSLAFVLVLSTQNEAERRHGTAETSVAARGDSDAAPIDPMRLGPLLARGDLVFLDDVAAKSPHVSVIGLLPWPAALVKERISEPEGFGAALVRGSKVRIVKREETSTTFEWRIPLPIVGTSGTMELTPNDDGVRVHAVDGALNGGTFRYAVSATNGGSALIGDARFDPAEASVLLGRLVESVPGFGPGLAAASQVMVVRAIRNRLLKGELQSEVPASATP